MKLNIKNLIYAGLFCSAVVAVNSCGTEATLDTIAPVTDGARVKFLHAIQGGPALIVYANGKKFSAVLNSIANGPDSIVYGGTFPITDYSVLPAGANNFELKTPASANPASATITSSSLTLENGKYYTVIAADTLPNPRLVTITDDRSAIKSEKKTYLRFVNLLTGGSPTGYEFVLRRQGASTILSTLKYGEAGAVVEIDPYLVGSPNDSFFIRVPGTTFNTVVVNSGTTLSSNRLRTFVLRGKPSAVGLNAIINN